LRKEKKHSWSKSEIDSLFKEVYINKNNFIEDVESEITLMQSAIKQIHKDKFSDSQLQSLDYMEAANPVVDGRRTDVGFVTGEWANGATTLIER